MKIYMDATPLYSGIVRRKKGYLIIKLTLAVLLMFVLQANAASYAQKVTLDKKVSLEEFFKEINSQTGYNFLYSPQVLDRTQEVTISVKDASLTEVLNLCFESQPVTYQIENKTIIVRSKDDVSRAAIELRQNDVIVSGTVRDASGQPLPGVTVRVKGTSKGASTGVNGEFTINAATGGTLVFSMIGFQAQERPVTKAESGIKIMLRDDVSTLDEVVVVGYGTRKRTSVVSAVDQVSSSAFEGRPSVNATQALQGMSPSISVQQRNFEPGAGMNFNVRGISTFGDNSPLVVIDNIVGGDINTLNPADIESISVLKDAGSAAIYGSRASNGVVLVTTKKGSKNSKPVISYNGLAGVNSPHMFFKPVSAWQNAVLRNEAAVNAGQSSAIYSPQEIMQMKENGDSKWFVDEILKDAWQQNHNLSVTGGSENTTYLVSFGLSDQRSNFVGPEKGWKRYNYRVNLTSDYKKFKFGSSLGYTRSDGKDHASTTGTLMVDAARVPLLYSQKDDEGRYLTNDVLQEFNPLGLLEKGGFRHYKNDNIFASVSADYSITNDFKLRGVVGGNVTNNSTYERVMRVDYFPKGISGADRNTNDNSWKGTNLNTQLMAQYTKTFNELHNVDLLIGVSNENSESRGFNLNRRYTDPDLGIPTTGTVIDAGSKNSVQNSGENSLNSLFGRLSYDYENKYYGEFNFRYDGSSKFAKDNRWGFFPAVSLGYRISQEDFMANYRERVGDVKLRGSYGVVGNQNVGNFQYQTTYFGFSNAYGFGNQAVGGTGFTYGNSEIRWEKAATLNVGVDMAFLKNSLLFVFDYFDKTTRDILVPPRVPGLFGTGLPDFNAGKMRNNGWEAALTYRKAGKLFKHNLTFNVGDSRNKVLNFEGDERLSGQEEIYRLMKVGFPYGSYVALRRDGYFQNMEEVASGPKPAGLDVQPGDIRYVDANKDGVIDNRDLYVFGNAFPRFNFGLNYEIGYRNFDLSVFIQGVGKRTTQIRGELVEPFHFNYGMTMYQHQLDYWTPGNPDAEYPRLAANGSASNTNNFRRGSDLYLFNAAYARLKNVQLGYNLPSGFVNKAGVKKARVYVSGQNLLTLSKLTFVDPETSEFNNNMRSDGANSGRSYPTMVYYGFGLDVTF